MLLVNKKDMKMNTGLDGAKENYKIACQILGKQRASYALKRMAKKLSYFTGLYEPAIWEQYKDCSLSVLGEATSRFKCPSSYKANQRALHALRGCLDFITH
jgi:hypothetical protein